MTTGYKTDLLKSSIFIICAFLIVISSCTQVEYHLILRRKTGQEYRTNGQTCSYGSYFYKEPHPIDCVCSRGLWVFYEKSCGNPTLIQGSEKQICTSIEFPVQKSLMVSDTVDEPIFSVLHSKDGIILKLFQNSINYPFKLNEGELILVSEDWKIEFQDGRSACLGKSQHFCLYESSSMENWIIDNVIKGGCVEDHNFETLKPWLCTRFSTQENDDQDCPTSRRDRREAPIPGGQQGRALIPAIIAMNPDFAANYNREPKPTDATAKYPPEDEDDEQVNREGHQLIKSEIWNYLTATTNVILRLIDEPTTKEYKIPAFTFLNIAKQIMQKTCPPYYVPPGHFDLAVNIFRSIQIRDMMYNEPPISHEQYERITNALTLCQSKIKRFNFTVIRDPACNTSKYADNYDTVLKDVSYPFDPLQYVGMFQGFDENFFVDVPPQLSPWSREPIIETVWSIFFHTHSVCFPYFNTTVSNSSYNDHHKFSTVMMTLFTNGIQTIWTEMKSELSKDIYSGFLGDAKMLMANVAHCSLSGRLDRNETYPWDLVKPGVTNIPTKPPVNRRTKRQVPPVAFLRENNQAQLGCLGTMEENSFVCKQ